MRGNLNFVYFILDQPYACLSNPIVLDLIACCPYFSSSARACVASCTCPIILDTYCASARACVDSRTCPIVLDTYCASARLQSVCWLPHLSHRSRRLLSIGQSVCRLPHLSRRSRHLLCIGQSVC